MSNPFTTRELAEILGTETWRVRRLFEDGALAEPGRFAGKRTIPGTMIPEIVDELRRRGWLRDQEAAACDE